MVQHDFFTLVDVVTNDEHPLRLWYDDQGGYDGVPAKPVTIHFGETSVKVNPQQLTELGALFLALGGVEGIDFSSADSLLEGFDLKGKQAAKKLAAALEE